MKLPGSWYSFLLLFAGIVLIYVATVVRTLSANLAILCGSLGVVIVVHQIGRFYGRDFLFSSSVTAAVLSSPAVPTEESPITTEPPKPARGPLSEEFVRDDVSEIAFPPPPIEPKDIGK